MKMITDCVDAVTQIPKDYQAEVIPPPPAVKIELTSRCDLQCSFCATAHSQRPVGDMEYNFLKYVLFETWRIGVREVGMFYLGESLLYRHLVEGIQYARELGFEHIFLTTNGRLLTEGKADTVIRAGLTSLKFSVNARDRDHYKEMTHVDGFEKVIANIQQSRIVRDRVFRETGHWCGIFASSIWYDDQEPERMKNTLVLIQDAVDQHYWLPLYNQAGLVPHPGATPGDMGRIGAMRPAVPCWSLFREGHVTWDGILTGCPFGHTHDWDCGDLKQQSFMQCWNSEAAQKLRRAHLSGDVHGTVCERCIYT